MSGEKGLSGYYPLPLSQFSCPPFISPPFLEGGAYVCGGGVCLEKVGPFLLALEAVFTWRQSMFWFFGFLLLFSPPE